MSELQKEREEAMQRLQVSCGLAGGQSVRFGGGEIVEIVSPLIINSQWCNLNNFLPTFNITFPHDPIHLLSPVQFSLIRPKDSLPKLIPLFPKGQLFKSGFDLLLCDEWYSRPLPLKPH